MDGATFDVLERFNVRQRAALVAGEVEGLAPLDLELVLGSSAGSVRRRLSDTRRLFLGRRAAAAERTVAPHPGTLEQRIRTIVDQALTRSAR